MASTVSLTSSCLRSKNSMRLLRTTLAEGRQGDNMPPIDSITSPALSALQPGLNHKLLNRFCMTRSNSCACSILFVLSQLRTISVSFGICCGILSHLDHPRSNVAFGSRRHAPERHMQTNSMHDSTALPGSNGTPNVVNNDAGGDSSYPSLEPNPTGP